MEGVERTVKALRDFYYMKKGKKASACPVFKMEIMPKNHTTEESVSLILHHIGKTAGQLSPLTPLLASTWSKQPY
jgi:hypothetical protein